MLEKFTVMLALLFGCAALTACASREAETMDDQNYREVQAPQEQIADEPPAPALITLPNNPTATPTLAATAPAEPDLRGHERDWDLMIYRPHPGTTAHFPVYYHDTGVGYTPQPDPTSVPGPGFDAALSGADAHNLKGNTLAGAAVEPFKFVFDTVVLPVNLVIHPPLSYTTTPPISE